MIKNETEGGMRKFVGAKISTDKTRQVSSEGEKLKEKVGTSIQRSQVGKSVKSEETILITEVKSKLDTTNISFCRQSPQHRAGKKAKNGGVGRESHLRIVSDSQSHLPGGGGRVPGGGESDGW